MTKTSVKRKKSIAEEAETTAKKAKTVIPAADEEPKKYEYKFLMDIIDNAAYDANAKDLAIWVYLRMSGSLCQVR